MKKNIFLALLFAVTVNFAFAQKLNLDPVASGGSRFTVTDRVWPASVGDADVCLWNDDKIAAFTITIDDNMEGDVSYWESMHTKYGFNFTWFVITEALDNKYNVSDWSLYQGLAAAGHQINGHDDINFCNDPTGHVGRADHAPLLSGGVIVNPTPAVHLARLHATTLKIEAEVTNGGNKCLTYAYPMGEGMIDEARKEYIAMRGTLGLLNNINKVNYLDVNSVSNPHIYDTPAERDKYILPLLDKTSKLYNVNYYRGWGSTHFHGIPDATSRAHTDEFLQYLKDKEDALWVDGFTRVAQYSQSFATHTLVVDDNQPTQIKFTLTDQMLDASFNFPLTVKVKVNNNWESVTATQNGSSVEAKLITHNGDIYALVKAVPDAGQVTIVGVEDADPAVITTISDKVMVVQGSLQVDFSASTSNALDNISFTVSGLPTFGVFTDNTDKTGKIVLDPEWHHVGVYNIVVTAYNGRSYSKESFQLTVNNDGNTSTIDSDNKDASVYFPLHGFVDPNNRTSTISGGGYVAGKQMSSVFPFQLPTVPSGLMVVAARFSVNLETVANVTSTLDLYGIDARSLGGVIVDDCYAGVFDADANATGIQEDFVNKNTATGVVNATSVGENNLVTYLNDQYLTASAGDFVFLRISTNDVNQSSDKRFVFTTADGALSLGSPYPTLIIRFGDNLSNDVVEVSDVNIYPNPVTNKIVNVSSVDFKNSKGIDVVLYNVEGMQVMHTVENAVRGKFDVDLQNLSSGVYFIRITNNNTVIVRKIFIK